MPVQSPREIAARVLQVRDRTADYVENLLDPGLQALSPADRRLCQELVYGVVRWQRTLDWLIARQTEGRTQKATLQILLRLGLYQMFWLDRIPDHAAVHETVALARQLGYGPQSGFVNALLRHYGRERDETRQRLEDLKRAQPGLGWSHPDWLCARWQQRWGAGKLRQLLEWNNTPPPTFARVNTLRADPGKLLERWRDEGLDYALLREDWFEDNLVFELRAHPPLAGLPSFRQGLFYVQDPSTLLAVRLLDPKPGETVLDLCAAPGGKTTYIAQLIQNRGRLVAGDSNDLRLQLLRENCDRLGISCVQTVVLGNETNPFARPHPAPSAMEPGSADLSPLPSGPGETAGSGAKSALRFPSAPLDSTPVLPVPEGTAIELGAMRARRSADFSPPPAVSPGRRGSGLNSALLNSTGVVPGGRDKFDRVLLDAPCSNTGVMRRRVDLRWRIRPEEIDRLKSVQLELLDGAALQTKSGGVLVYSTCSLEPEENGEVVKEFLAGHANFKLERERELLPFVDGVDGAFVAQFVKR